MLQDRKGGHGHAPVLPPFRWARKTIKGAFESEVGLLSPSSFHIRPQQILQHLLPSLQLHTNTFTSLEPTLNTHPYSTLTFHQTLHNTNTVDGSNTPLITFNKQHNLVILYPPNKPKCLPQEPSTLPPSILFPAPYLPKDLPTHQHQHQHQLPLMSLPTASPPRHRA